MLQKCVNSGHMETILAIHIRLNILKRMLNTFREIKLQEKIILPKWQCCEYQPEFRFISGI